MRAEKQEVHGVALGVAFAPKEDSLIEGQSPGGWHP